MKPQDILFIIIIGIALLLRKPKLLVGVGLVFFLLSVPLFVKWIFFTAERLVEWGLLSIIFGAIWMIFSL